MDVGSAVLLLNTLARRSVEDRLYFIKNGESIQETTQTVVSAVDPLRPIAEVVDPLRVMPTRPTASNCVEVAAGHFYCRGRLYYFQGGITDPIELHPTIDTNIIVGLKIDTRRNTVDLFQAYEFSMLPALPNDVFPLAVIKVSYGIDYIISDQILDLRPFLVFDVAGPRDRVEKQIDKLESKEIVVIDRKPYHSNPPVCSLYKKLPGSDTTEEIRIAFTDPERIVGLVNEDRIEKTTGGISLKPSVLTLTSVIPNDLSAVYLSVWGSTGGLGTYEDPVSTLDRAVELLNAFGKTKLYIMEGQYQNVSQPLVLNQSLEIIGQSPTQSIIIPSGTVFSSAFALTMKKIGIHNHVQSTTVAPYLFSSNELSLVNCIVRNMVDAPYPVPICHSGDLTIRQCVFHNTMLETGFNARLATATSSMEIFANNILMGKWIGYSDIPGYNEFYANQYNVFNSVDPGVINASPVGSDYNLLEDSIAKNAGDITWGLDVDGSWTDIGVYGGPEASGGKQTTYNVLYPVVAYVPTGIILGTDIAEIVDIEAQGSFPANTEVCYAVRIGGRSWLVWSEEYAAWIAILPEAISAKNMSLETMKAHIMALSPLWSEATIEFAVCLKTTVNTVSPSFGALKLVVAPADGRLQLLSTLEGLSVRHAGDYTVITNETEVIITDLYFVAY